MSLNDRILFFFLIFNRHNENIVILNLFGLNNRVVNIWYRDSSKLPYRQGSHTFSMPAVVTENKITMTVHNQYTSRTLRALC